MRTHIDVLSGLIDDLFELSRLEAGDIQWTLQQVSLGQLVEEAVDALRPQADAKGVSVQADVRAQQPARANPEKVQRVLFNLIQNAIRHTPADGSVTVLAEASNGRVEVEVSDTGDGIEAERPPARVRAVLSRRPRDGAHACRAPGSASRSRARSSRRTAGGSGWPTRRPARACASRCPGVNPPFDLVRSVLPMGGVAVTTIELDA